VAERNVYRGDALEADLGALCGRAFERSLPLLPAGEHYERRVSSAAAGDGARLVGHAYTRYLGDLNGGRALEVLLARSLGLGPEALAFYAYPAADLPELRRAYRAALDATGAFVDVEVVAAEALAAFRLNIALSEAVRSAAPAVPRTRLPGPAR
jgi:heme oxygenase